MSTDARELLWAERPVATRGPKPALTVPKIVATAIAIADTEGLDAATLQRVAAEHGFTKMALYRYLDGKDDLVALMIDEAVGEVVDLDGIDGWRERAVAFCDAVAQAWQEHPWVPWVTLGDRLMGPRETSWVQAGLVVFDGTGLTTREQLDATSMLFGLLRSTHSVARTGTLPWVSGPRSGEQLQQAMSTRPEEFAVLATALADAGESPDDARSFGLSVVLDGLEALIARRA